MFFLAEPEAAMELKQLGSIDSKNGELSVLVKPSPPPRGGKSLEPRPMLNKGGHSSRMGRESDISMKEDSTEIIQVWVLSHKLNMYVHLI